MKNFELEQMGVQEMDAVESKTVDGGILPLIIIGAALLLGGCATTREVNEASYIKGQQERDTTLNN
jgi:hypothetical protein